MTANQVIENETFKEAEDEEQQEEGQEADKAAQLGGETSGNLHEKSTDREDRVSLFISSIVSTTSKRRKNRRAFCYEREDCDTVNVANDGGSGDTWPPPKL